RPGRYPKIKRSLSRTDEAKRKRNKTMIFPTNEKTTRKAPKQGAATQSITRKHKRTQNKQRPLAPTSNTRANDNQTSTFPKKY
ncbi:hypothetical protein, partial [Corynebacterium sp. HMSC074C03]|uniref:hypothetical protein n=1 Tax=Corynebacterium sp. HMSC074C03 TaxID=1739351 RepID=UPI001AF01402